MLSFWRTPPSHAPQVTVRHAGLPAGGAFYGPPALEPSRYTGTGVPPTPNVGGTPLLLEVVGGRPSGANSIVEDLPLEEFPPIVKDDNLYAYFRVTVRVT
eukprot:1193662-Prorocentrum_minimum.AAC.2